MKNNLLLIMTIFLYIWGIYSVDTDKAPLVLHVQDLDPQMKSLELTQYYYLQEPQNDYTIWYQSANEKIIMLSKHEDSGDKKQWILANIYDMNQFEPLVYGRYEHGDTDPPVFPSENEIWKRRSNKTEDGFKIKVHVPSIPSIRVSKENQRYLKPLLKTDHQVMTYAKKKLEENATKINATNRERAPLVLHVQDLDPKVKDFKLTQCYYLQQPRKKGDLNLGHKVQHDHNIWYLSEDWQKIIMLSTHIDSEKKKQWILGSTSDMELLSPTVYGRYDHGDNDPPAFPTEGKITEDEIWKRYLEKTKDRFKIKVHIPSIASIKLPNDNQRHLTSLVQIGTGVMMHAKKKLEENAMKIDIIKKEEFDSLCRSYKDIDINSIKSNIIKQFTDEIHAFKKKFIYLDQKFTYQYSEKVDQITKKLCKITFETIFTSYSETKEVSLSKLIQTKEILKSFDKNCKLLDLAKEDQNKIDKTIDTIEAKISVAFQANQKNIKPTTKKEYQKLASKDENQIEAANNTNAEAETIITEPTHMIMYRIDNVYVRQEDDESNITFEIYRLDEKDRLEKETEVSITKIEKMKGIDYGKYGDTDIWITIETKNRVYATKFQKAKLPKDLIKYAKRDVWLIIYQFLGVKTIFSRVARINKECYKKIHDILYNPEMNELNIFQYFLPDSLKIFFADAYNKKILVLADRPVVLKPKNDQPPEEDVNLSSLYNVLMENPSLLNEPITQPGYPNKIMIFNSSLEFTYYNVQSQQLIHYEYPEINDIPQIFNCPMLFHFQFLPENYKHDVWYRIDELTNIQICPRHHWDILYTLIFTKFNDMGYMKESVELSMLKKGGYSVTYIISEIQKPTFNEYEITAYFSNIQALFIIEYNFKNMMKKLIYNY